jgi:hypothetical protein
MGGKTKATSKGSPELIFLLASGGHVCPSQQLCERVAGLPIELGIDFAQDNLWRLQGQYSDFRRRRGSGRQRSNGESHERDCDQLAAIHRLGGSKCNSARRTFCTWVNCWRQLHVCPGTNAAVSVECEGAAGRPVTTEVEANLHQASGLNVDWWKRPLLGRLDGEALEIPAGTGSIRSGSVNRTVLVNDDSYPHFDMPNDGSTGAHGNFRDHRMLCRW